MELYTTPAPSTQWESRPKLLAAIMGSREALEGKIESVAIEVNLFRADLWKVSGRVQITEGSISELREEVTTLRQQMAEVTSRAETLEARVENAEGRSRRNNVRFIRFPEQAEGYAMEAVEER
ncbi:hypothetical protein NDU88_007889 [Pleurodeles waltl]|uniref:Uncharacterized protein n=1 Tax=Pleurodeles waltl TaxID=8319 RepID=A0AAV7RS84_PLEWA|nr:hypothetical protein NDU88_007889 [Pleurodeles waltl]